MVEAVTPPNPADSSDKNRTVPDPTLLSIDLIRREITMAGELTEAKLDAAEELTKERFRSVDALMERSEEQRKEQKADTKAAVDDALDSQKEATAKMEKSISDQITSLLTNFTTSISAIQGNVSDLKDRLTALESVKQGQVEQRSESRQSTAGVYAAIGLGITLILAALTVIGFAMANAA